MTHPNISEDAITGHAARVLTKLLYTAYIAVFTIVVIAAGGAAWVTRTDITLNQLQKDVREVKDLFASDYAIRLRELERTVAPGVLVEAKNILEEHEDRLDALERAGR